MIIAIMVLTAVGSALGFLLAGVSRLLTFEEDPLVEQVTEMLPNTQCGQCGYAGCRQAAAALVAGDAPLTLCPPGGAVMSSQLAELLGRPLGGATRGTERPSIAKVAPDLCIGCTRCIRECPTDALVGAVKQMHVVLDSACTGCGACVEVCPTAGIRMQQTPLTLGNWRWSKPGTGHRPDLIATA